MNDMNDMNDIELNDNNIKFIINYLTTNGLENFNDNNLETEDLKTLIIKKLPKESIIKLLEIQSIKEDKDELLKKQETEMKKLLKNSPINDKKEERVPNSNVLKKYEIIYNHKEKNKIEEREKEIVEELKEQDILENDRIKRRENYLVQEEINKIREKYKYPYNIEKKKNERKNDNYPLKNSIFNAFKNYKRTIDLSRDNISYYKTNEEGDRPIGLNNSIHRIPYAKTNNENKELTFRERMEQRLKDIGINRNSTYNNYEKDPQLFVKVIDTRDDTNNLDKSKRPSLKLLIDKLKNKYINNAKYDRDEMEFYNTLSDIKKDKVDKLEHKISKINNIKTPLRFRILASKLSISNKSTIINKLENLTSNKMFGSSEITKYSNWVTSLLKIPFGKYCELPIDSKSSDKEVGNYLINVKNTLDSAVYGHEKTKEQILQVLAQWISKPDSVGNFISIEGPAGNGKTTLVKNGISKAIGRPFAFISLGGATDASFLDGHSFTYEGSMYGKIADILMNCKCMNPVFYFDELDKISKSQKGDEISNLLIHLTDSSQNDQFNDKYFNGITFDLSKALFIFSYNIRENVNPILLDRLINIKTKGFEMDDKIKIAKDYLIPEICDMLSIKQDEIILEDDTLKYIIKEFTGEEEGGVRTLKKVLYNIFSRINLLNLTKHNDDIKYTFDTDIKKNEKNATIIDEETLKKLILEDKDENSIPPSIEHLYI
jgi:ATP-dependent Lon protease